ncbi:MAG TPA: type IV pilus modification protein PilV [Thioalkalivibrio sp.]|nr:type IV pilus modification protein PilV [Thioalkalivibrio sp.]
MSMQPTHNYAARRQEGFTLTEVLVAVIVLSIGLLGLAGLQANSLKFNHSAYMRSQATHLAYSITDKMRANRSPALQGAYDVGLDETVSGSTVASQDLAAWKALIQSRLPDGKGGVCRSSNGNTCSGSGNIIIVDVQWDDSRGAESAQTFRFVTAL